MVDDKVAILPLVIHSTSAYGAMNINRSVAATLRRANRDYNADGGGLPIDPDTLVVEMQEAARDRGLRVPARGAIITALRSQTSGGRGEYITSDTTFYTNIITE
jgi:hypothetical protein